jgi:hypothetical protein
MTTPDISIEDIRLHLQKHIEDKVLIIMTLRNNSKTLTYYVSKRPRYVEYDRGSHTLSIALYAMELSGITILPDTALEWRHLHPAWIKKIHRPRGSKEIVEVFDMYGVQKAVCTVGENISASFDRTIIYP